ncbi:MAG: glycosyltransferase family 4 protein [Cytophagaceae bacterium]|nr:glycosyltransferase family 4 protein [Cytophagaceae bacterium]MDW8456643.1 glycosyltransferase family 4 protein [Cytophagaceae bacterium]
MKILYLHQYFRTPQQGGAIRSYHIAKAMIAYGHKVEMITSWNHRYYHREEVEGIIVHYLPVFYENNLKTIGRIVSFVKFMIKAYRKALSVSDVDICYATSTPLTIGLIALALKKKKNIPYVFEVRDLWPEAPIQMRVIRNFFLKKILFRMEKRIYQGAERIIALSPGIEAGIRKVVPHKKVVMIPNMSDTDFFIMEEKKEDLAEKYHVHGAFVVSYFGSVGKANHLDFMLDAALACKKSLADKVKFIIAGRGSEYEKIKDRVKSQLADTVYLFPHVDKVKIKELMNVSDAVYISFANVPVLETCSPNKFFDGLAAGKICITNTAGWIKELIEKHELGFYHSPREPESFVQKINPYVQNTELCNEHKKNARHLAESQFDKKYLTGLIMQQLENINKM